MPANGFTGSIEEGPPRTPPRVIFLSILMTGFLGGGLYALSLIHRSATWAVWLSIFIIILISARELPLWRLLVPFMPYLAWLGFYLIWGMIVSPTADIAFASKTVITTTILALSMAILTAKPNYLRTFANIAQFAVTMNLLLWVLMPWSSQISTMLMRITGQTDPDIANLSRYGGMLGNPNMLGYICLVTTILSILAVPLIGWMGRLSCLPLLYLAESRKAVVLYLVIILIYLIVVQRRNIKFWGMSVLLVFSFAIIFILGDGLRATSRSVANNQAISRIMDLEEEETREKGGITRADLLHHWLSTLREEPWYGYGLRAMVGRVYDEEHPGKVLVKGPYPWGTHNTYLGVWVDVGPIGFITFVLMLIHYLSKCLFSGGDPITKWVLSAFLVVNLTFLFVSHSHLFCFEGMAAFTLFFALPSSPSLRELGRSLEWKHD